MKKTNLPTLLTTYAPAVLVILCGLVLIFSPDSASVLVSRLLSAVLLVWGLGCLLTGLFGSGDKGRSFLMAAVALIGSRWLSRNPLGLAAGISRILGICLLLGAVGGFLRSRTTGGKLLSLGEGVLGLTLILLPLAASRLVFTVCGLVVTALGITMLVEACRSRRRLDSGRGPRIFDSQ